MAHRTGIAPASGPTAGPARRRSGGARAGRSYGTLEAEVREGGRHGRGRHGRGGDNRYVVVGFVWDARIRMAPLVSIRVRDSYVRGRAGMLGRVASVVPVVSRGDTPERASATLHRWLAEAPWFPTALLPSEGVVWSPIDEESARATMTDGGITVSLDFTFGDDGRIERAYTPARYRDVDGAAVPTPWACHYRRYESVTGVRVPMAGSTSWLLPEGELTYWRGRLIDLSFGS